MFENIGEWLTQIRVLAAMGFLAVVAVLTAATAMRTKSTPMTIGVALGGVVALAILAKMDAMAMLVGGELDGTAKTTADTGGVQIISEFGESRLGAGFASGDAEGGPPAVELRACRVGAAARSSPTCCTPTSRSKTTAPA